ncbi:MAG: hypothetical protein DDT28_00588 [Dehalococcoidia bacterium]|nr:hypothetical protein [Chloroflexota bacterium]
MNRLEAVEQPSRSEILDNPSVGILDEETGEGIAAGDPSLRVDGLDKI